MAAYFKTSDGAAIYHYGDVQLEHSDWDPSQPLPEGWTFAEIEEYPELEQSKSADLQVPKLVDGKMIATWKIRPATSAEIAFKQELLEKYNKELLETE